MRVEFVDYDGQVREADVDLTISPVSEDDIVAHRGPDGRLKVGYLGSDDAHGDYWSDNENGEFEEFGSQDARDEWIAEREAEGKVALVVDNYRHGNDHYSLQGTVNYPDRRWDVAPRAVIVLPDDLAEDYRKSESDPGERNKAVARINAILDEFSSWANGEVYVRVIETFERDGAGWESLDYDVVGGYIGAQAAIDALREDMGPDVMAEANRMIVLEESEALAENAETRDNANAKRIEQEDRLGGNLDEVRLCVEVVRDFHAFASGATRRPADPALDDGDSVAEFAGGLKAFSRGEQWVAPFGHNGDNLVADSLADLAPALYDHGVREGYIPRVEIMTEQEPSL